MTATASFPETRLPRQIRERMERIKAMEAEQESGAEPPIAAEVVTPPGDALAANPNAEPPAAETLTTTEPLPDLRPFHDPALETDPRAQDPTYWRQRLSVAEGMLRGRLQQERQRYDAREAVLNDKISELEGQIRELKAAKPVSVDVSAMLSPEHVEALGQDHANAIAQAAVAAARQQVEATLAEQRQSEQDRRKRDSDQAQERARRDFLDALADAVPDWQIINARQDWLSWLREVDVRTGLQRQAALTDAESAGDIQALARIFGEFRQTIAPRPAPPVTAPRSAGTPAAPTPAQAVDLSMVPPTDAEVRQYYKDLSVNGGRAVSAAQRELMEKRLRLL